MSQRLTHRPADEHDQTKTVRPALAGRRGALKTDCTTIEPYGTMVSPQTLGFFVTSVEPPTGLSLINFEGESTVVHDNYPSPPSGSEGPSPLTCMYEQVTASAVIQSLNAAKQPQALSEARVSSAGAASYSGQKRLCRRVGACRGEPEAGHPCARRRSSTPQQMRQSTPSNHTADANILAGANTVLGTGGLQSCTSA